MPGLRFLPWLEILDSGETIRVEHCVEHECQPERNTVSKHT